MSEKSRELPQLADTTYAHTLVIESTHECTFDNHHMSIGCVGKLGLGLILFCDGWMGAQIMKGYYERSKSK